MQERDIAILAFFLIWLVITITFGLLALRFKAKHKIYTLEKDKWKAAYNNAAADFKLTPVPIKYELPSGETCYFTHQCSIFNDFTKQARWEKKYQKHFTNNTIEDDDEWDYRRSSKDEFYDGKNTYRFAKKSLGKALYTGTLYVTNNRLLIETPTGSHQWPLNDIEQVLPTVQYENIMGYFQGTHIKFKSGKGLIVQCNNINSVLTLQALL